MKFIEKCNEVLGFTPSERRVILILMLSFLAGWGIRFYKRSHEGRAPFDYSAVDSEFAARSSAFAEALKDTNASVGKPQRNGAPALVNINTASKAELIGLPGIGEAMAERIILYREDHGPFTSVKELGGVKGIGPKKLEKLVPLCTTVR